MATIEISATGLTKRTWTLSASDTQRILAAYRIQYNSPSATDQQIFNKFADGVFRDIGEIARHVERTTAADAVAPIPIVVS